MATLDPPAPPRTPWVIPIAVGVAVGALAIWRVVAGKEPDRPAIALPASASASEAPRPAAPPRCGEFPKEPFVIGDLPARPKGAAPPVEGAASAAPLPAVDEVPDTPDDELAPFAVEIGRGAVFDGGFAAGVKRSAEGGSVAMIAMLGFDGAGGKLVRLERSRGDFDAPVVTGAGASVLVALLEPDAGGRSIKVGKVTGDQVAWGVEIPEGRDESQVLDLASSGAHALVVWDAVARGSERSSVMLASFDVATMRAIATARPVSAPTTDAETPRLIARPGGYWLGYLARGEEHPAKKAKGEKKQDKKVDGDWVDDDDAPLGEVILHRWVELMPLDESGLPVSAARAITPKNGHALAFDLELGDDGGAIVAWRDDDTPAGATGGRLHAALARLSGVGEAHVLAEDTGTAGVPDLLPGWISIASVSGATRIAAIDAQGQLLEVLAPEPSLGAGEPIAATKDAILWARPAGKAMRLGVVRCAPRGVSDPPKAGAQGETKAGDAGR